MSFTLIFILNLLCASPNIISIDREGYSERFIKDYDRDVCLRKFVTVIASDNLSTNSLNEVGAKITLRKLSHDVQTEAEVVGRLIDPNFEGTFIRMTVRPFSSLNTITVAEVGAVPSLTVSYWDERGTSETKVKTVSIYETERARRPFYLVEDDNDLKVLLSRAFSQQKTNSEARQAIKFYSLLDLYGIERFPAAEPLLQRWIVSSERLTYSHVLAPILSAISRSFESGTLKKSEQEGAAFAVYRISNAPHFLLWAHHSREQRIDAQRHFRSLMISKRVKGFDELQESGH